MPTTTPTPHALALNARLRAIRIRDAIRSGDLVEALSQASAIVDDMDSITPPEPRREALDDADSLARWCAEVSDRLGIAPPSACVTTFAGVNVYGNPSPDFIARLRTALDDDASNRRGRTDHHDVDEAAAWARWAARYLLPEHFEGEKARAALSSVFDAIRPTSRALDDWRRWAEVRLGLTAATGDDVLRESLDGLPALVEWGESARLRDRLARALAAANPPHGQGRASDECIAILREQLDADDAEACAAERAGAVQP